MKTLAVATLLSIGLVPVSYSAMVQASQDNPSGPYFGVGWGKFNLDIDNLSDVGTATSNILKADDNAWKAFAGWRFNPYVALEAAYIDFGSPTDRFDSSGTDGNYRVDLSGFAPSIVASIPFGPVELFAKAGSYFYNVKLKVDFDSPGPDIDSQHDRNDYLYGGGVGITLAERLHLRAEYEVLDIKNAGNSDAYWLSAAWRF